VRHGGTDPREVRKFLNAGVVVYNKPLLHAKFVLIGDTLIVGSANASSRSATILEEAALLTTHSATVASAWRYFRALCTTPVRPAYLELCEREYKPPTFPAHRSEAAVQHDGRSLLWFITGLRLLDLNDEDEALMQRTVAKLESKLSRPNRSEVSWIRYARKPKFYDRIKPGAIVIRSLAANGKKLVYPPAQVISKRTWVSAKNRRYVMIFLGSVQDEDPLPMSSFLRRALGTGPFSSKTRPVTNPSQAEALMRLWTTSGQARKGRRTRRLSG
jgi:hypothetical protein